MYIDTKKALECFEDIIELPIFGTALYFKMMEYQDAISADIEEFKDMLKLRKMIKQETKPCPKSSSKDYIRFEVVKLGKKLWVPVLPDKKDCKASEIFPGKLVDYIVEKSSEMTPGIIEWKRNLILPEIKGKVFDIGFEKVKNDYIYGLIKGLDFSIPDKSYNVDVDVDQQIKALKNIDFDEVLGVFRLIIESPDFRKQIFKEYRKVWMGLQEKYQ